MRAGWRMLDPRAFLFRHAPRLFNAHHGTELRSIGLFLERQRLQRDADRVREPRRRHALRRVGLHLRRQSVRRDGHDLRFDHDAAGVRQSAGLLVAVAALSDRER
jgi:hypothetical protein